MTFLKPSVIIEIIKLTQTSEITISLKKKLLTSLNLLKQATNGIPCPKLLIIKRKKQNLDSSFLL